MPCIFYLQEKLAAMGRVRPKSGWGTSSAWHGDLPSTRRSQLEFPPFSRKGIQSELLWARSTEAGHVVSGKVSPRTPKLVPQRTHRDLWPLLR